VVDGNVERVIQRLAAWGSGSGEGQAELVRNTGQMAHALLDPARPGDFNQAMMELGATICLPRSPKCLTCPLNQVCQTRGEHPVPARARMRSEDAAYALVIRSSLKSREVLLDQRGADQTVMPGMWELPALRDSHIADAHLRMAVRHAIMRVNYYVRIRTVFEEDAEALIVPSQNRQWVRLYDLAALPLTGLARKVLLRARLSELAPNPQRLQPAGGAN
jgi:A/G-specific adenine glycosylase